MSNISVLRHITRDTTTNAVVLFDPADAIRSISAGVTVDYYLKQAAEKVTIEFLDAQGKTITTFSGSPKQPGARGRGETAPVEADDEEGRGRGGAPARVEVAAGMNRFTWDMRYPNARGFPGLIMWAASTRGPIAPPGRYQVRLTANGVTQTQDFTIVRNARVATVTDADLVAQFTLAKHVSDKVTIANETVLRIRSLKYQIAARVGKSDDQALKTSGQSLSDKLTSVEGEIYQYRNRSNQDPLNYPIRLNNKLAALQGIIESGDARPTDQSHAVFKELSARLDKELARLTAIIKSDLSALNTMLADRKLEPIKDGVPAGTQ
jgi:hypothetical protein